MPKRTLVFFDVDGVLIDGYHFNPTHRRMWSDNIKADLGIAPEHLAAYFKNHWAGVIIGHDDLYTTMQIHLQENGYTHAAQDVIDYWLSHDAHINANAWAVAKSWAEQPNTTLYLATNQEPTRAAYLWDTLNFKLLFKQIFYSGMLGVTKDNPAFFAHINTQLSIAPQTDRVLYFDDTPACLASARKAGWQNTIQITTADDITRPSS